jgi:putative membrane protein
VFSDSASASLFSFPDLSARPRANPAGASTSTPALPGIHLGAAGRHSTANDWLTLGVIALLLAVVNAAIRPIMILRTLPLTVLTLGLFFLVVNALILILTANIAEPMPTLSLKNVPDSLYVLDSAPSGDWRRAGSAGTLATQAGQGATWNSGGDRR